MFSGWEDQWMGDQSQHQACYADEKAQMDDSMMDYPSGSTFVQSRLPDSSSYHNSNAYESFMPLEDPFSDGFVPLCGDIPMNDFTHDPYSQPFDSDYSYNNSSTPLDDFEDALFSPDQPPMVDTSQIPVDSIESPPTPASILPASKPNAQQIKTPCKSNKKVRKPKAGNPNTEKKKFPCPYPGCTRASTCAANLEEHILTHTGVKEYACEICTASFSRPWGLRRHYETKHHIDVKVGKKRGVRNRVETGSPKKSGKTGGMDDQQPLPPISCPSISLPHVFAPTGDRINITTRGPEGPFSCCFMEFAGGNELVIHNHLLHVLPCGFLCSCNICQDDHLIVDELVQQNPISNEHPMDVEPGDEDMNIDPSLRTPATHIYCPTSSPSSDTSSTSSMATDSPIYTPSEYLPDANTDTEMAPPSYGTITFDASGFPVHNDGPVSPNTFYTGLGIEYNNLSNEKGRMYFGGDWE